MVLRRRLRHPGIALFSMRILNEVAHVIAARLGKIAQLAPVEEKPRATPVCLRYVDDARHGPG